jgi:hypothetical protein
VTKEEKRIDQLARKLRLAYHGRNASKWTTLPEAFKVGWRQVAEVAIAEVGKLPKDKPRAAPKSCRIDAHGKRVCN